ncbi:MAG: hypothetical protein JXR15_13095 [Shimia sp.]|uniref:hypothetical protein n=1 Tax=Shimia sp. TaxID=1954381 RepID=UPI003B8C5211
MNLTPEHIQQDLPRKLRNQAATLTAEGIASGESVSEARQKTASAMKRIYRRWLADIEDTHPRCAPAARYVLRKEGIL